MSDLAYQNINLTNGINTSNSETGASRVNNNLDKNAFLNLLITQMKYQDPLSPQDDKQFIAQMAQFSSLEQMQNLSKSFSNQQASSLIGKNIVASYYSEAQGMNVDVAGEVSSVLIKNGTAYLKVGSNEVPVDSVTDIYNKSSSSLDDVTQNIISGQGISLMGKTVQGFVVDADNNPIEYIEGKVSEVTFDTNGYPILTVNGKDMFLSNIINVSEENSLYEHTIKVDYGDDGSIEGKITNIKIQNDLAYIVIDGKEILIDKINYLTDSLKLVGKNITHGDISGTCDQIVIKDKVPYLSVNGELVSFTDYKGIA